MEPHLPLWLLLSGDSRPISTSSNCTCTCHRVCAYYLSLFSYYKTDYDLENLETTKTKKSPPRLSHFLEAINVNVLAVSFPLRCNAMQSSLVYGF